MTYHLRDSGNIVVTTAYEPNESLPGILTHDPDACEPGSLPPEVGVRGRPLIIELSSIVLQAEVVLDQAFRIIGVRSVFLSSRLGPSGPIVQVSIVLPQRQDAALKSHVPVRLGQHMLYVCLQQNHAN